MLALVAYFLRLGSLGFGGPVALANYIRRDLVVLVAALYRHYATAWWLRALFHGIAPAVVALIVKACWNLGKKTIGKDLGAWSFAVAACTITIALQREL